MTERVHRWHSPSVFTLIALCFVLPFATATFMSGCDGGTASEVVGRTSFTGIQLVTHAVPRGTGSGTCAYRSDGGWGRPDQCVERQAATPAEVAFGAAIAGVVLGLLGVVGGGWCALVGLAALLQIAVSLSGDQADGFGPRAGFWLLFVLFAWAGVLHFRRLRQRSGGIQTGTGPRGAIAAIVITGLAVAVVIGCIAVHVFWLSPLLWAVCLAVFRGGKVGDVKPEAP